MQYGSHNTCAYMHEGAVLKVDSRDNLVLSLCCTILIIFRNILTMYFDCLMMFSFYFQLQFRLEVEVLAIPYQKRKLSD